MPANQFSEFTFGFAFTQEVTTLCWDALAGAPEVPSLFDEGNGKGFDVAVGLWGWTLCAQFKRGELLTRSTALQWDSYYANYFRFEIYPNSKSTQHADLRALETASALNWVVYVAPVFHTGALLNAHFSNREVLENVRLIRPSDIGALDDQTHYVTYQGAADAVIVHSEPIRIESLSPVDLRRQLQRRDWERSALPATSLVPRPAEPRLLNDEYFDALADVVAEVSSSSLGAVTGDTRAMSSFGRARTMARLLLGSELIVLPAAGQGETPI